MAKKPKWEKLSLKEKITYLSSLPPEQKELITSELLALHELRESNPLMFFEPYGKQKEFLKDRSFTKAFFGGNRSGKTTTGIVDDLIQCVDTNVLPEALRKYKRWEPPFYCRIVSPKFGINEGVVLDKLRDLCPKDQLHGDRFDKAYDKVHRKLRFKNGSYILFNTADQDRDAHAGVKLHRVHFDEEPEGDHGFEIFKENRNRLADYFPNSQVLFTMTPLFGLSWTYDEVYERRDEKDVFCIVASMLDNPYIPKEFVDQQLSGLSKEERAGLIEGHFVHFHGRVLDGFSEHHLIDPPTGAHVRGLDCYVGIDPGITQGGVIWCGFDRDNSLLVFDELYPRDKDIPTIAAEIKAKNKLWGIAPIYVIDPSARNRSLTNLESVQGEFYRQQIFPIPGQSDRLAGVLQLRARLEAKTLHVARNCEHLRAEIKRWVIAKDEDTQRMKAKGAPGTFATLGADHLIDPLRYVAMQRVWGLNNAQSKKPRRDSWDWVGPFHPPPVVSEPPPMGPFS